MLLPNSLHLLRPYLFPFHAILFHPFSFVAFSFVAFVFRVHRSDKDSLYRCGRSGIYGNINIFGSRFLIQYLLLSLYLGLYLFRRHASLNLLEYLLSHLFPHRHPHLFQSEPFLFRPEPLDLTQANLFFLRNGWVGWFANARVVLSQNHGSGSDCQHCNCDCAFHRFLFFEIFLTFVATAP